MTPDTLYRLNITDSYNHIDSQEDDNLSTLRELLLSAGGTQDLQ